MMGTLYFLHSAKKTLQQDGRFPPQSLEGSQPEIQSNVQSGPEEQDTGRIDFKMWSMIKIEDLWIEGDYIST